MDEITKVKRIWESMEARLASMSGDITREYTVYCHGTDMGKTVNIDSDQDSDDIINLDEIEDFDEFMENVMDIERTQYLSYGKWCTKEYTIVTGTGGPHVEFTTGYSIHVYWGGQVLERTTHNDQARATIDRIEDYLNEIYE